MSKHSNLASVQEDPSAEAAYSSRPAPVSASRWRAFLSLGFQRTSRGTVLKTCEHKGPLYVQKAFYPEGADVAHTYLLHPPGGLVSGDKLSIEAKLAENCHVLITTPGAGRAYRAREDRSLQEQTTTLTVGEHSTLEWLPQETILYPNANTRLESVINLAKTAHFIGWEITCFGLPANQLDFDQGQAEQGLEIRVENSIKFRERLIINDANRHLMQACAGLQGAVNNGVMIAGPFPPKADTSSLIEQIRTVCDAHPATCGVTQTGEFLVLRALHHDCEAMKHLFSHCWQYIRPCLIDKPVCEPRIWAT
ncbi:urease accessory protein UreD [Marinomonas epiphytica]